MTVSQTKLFAKQKNKLHTNQINALDSAIKDIIVNPLIGIPKKGDLQGIRVYKFKMLNQEHLLAYAFSKNQILLLALGSHENFYRDLKKSNKT